MGKDILVILMMAFGLFGILMFILFYIYAKKHYNETHTSDEYTDLLNDDVWLVEILINKKKYLFDANGHNLKKNEKVRVFLDDEVFDGIVVNDIFHGNINKLDNQPKMLVLEEDLKKEEVQGNLNDEMDFIPKKKK